MNDGDSNAVAVAGNAAQAGLQSDAVDRTANAARLSAFNGIRLSYLPKTDPHRRCHPARFYLA
jgi:hypothetical protein